MMSMQAVYSVLIFVAAGCFALHSAAFYLSGEEVQFKRAVLTGLLCVMLMIEKYTSRRANKP